MRVLQLHCDNIEYTPTKKEISSAEDIEPKTVRFEEIVVCFVAIEKDDNDTVVQNAVQQIEDSMKKIGSKKLLLYPYAHLSADLASPTTAISILNSLEKSFNEIEVMHAPFGWTKSYQLKVKVHPLAESSKIITSDLQKEKTSAALDSESKIKSYWYILSPDGKMDEFDKFDFSAEKLKLDT